MYEMLVFYSVEKVWKIEVESGEVAQKLRVLASLAEVQSSGPSSHIW